MSSWHSETSNMKLEVLLAVQIVLLTGIANHAVRGQDDSNSLEELGACEDYYMIQGVFESCRNDTRGNDMDVTYLTLAARNMCRNSKRIKNCMKERLGACANWIDIEVKLSTSFSFCQYGFMPATLKHFLTINAGKAVSDRCLKTVLDEVKEAPNVCKPIALPKFSQASLSRSIQTAKGRVKWYFDCFLKIGYMNDVLPNCGNMNRHTVYAIIMTSILVKRSFGFTVYTRLKELITVENEVNDNAERVVCQNYLNAEEVFRSCRIQTVDQMNVKNILEESTAMCRHARKIRRCMKNHLGGCPNWDDIDSKLQVSLSLCVKGAVPSTLKTFLIQNAERSVSDVCFSTISNEIYESSDVCQPLSKPKYSSQSLDEAVHAVKGHFKWYFDCYFKMNVDMNEILPTCDNATRRTVYTIIMASIQVHRSFGFTLYPQIKYLITAPMNNQDQAQTPVSNYMPAGTPLSNFVPVYTPTTIEVPPSTQMSNHIQTEAQISNHVPTEAIMNNHVPTYPTISNDEPENGAITSNHIPTYPTIRSNEPNGAISGNRIRNQAPISNQIPNGAIISNHIPTYPTIGNHVSTGAIMSNHIQNEVPNSNQIPNGAIMSNHIPTYPTIGNNMPTGAIMSNHIQNEATISNHMPNGAIMSNHVPTYPTTSNPIPDSTPMSNHIPVERDIFNWWIVRSKE